MAGSENVYLSLGSRHTPHTSRFSLNYHSLLVVSFLLPVGDICSFRVTGPPDRFMADPVRDLNNFLQGQPGGSVTKDFQWLLTREGPEHGTIYHVTAVCKHCVSISLLFIHSCTTSPGSPRWGWTWLYKGHRET